MFQFKEMSDNAAILTSPLKTGTKWKSSVVVEKEMFFFFFLEF